MSDPKTAKPEASATDSEIPVINLRDPWLAALLAWLVPGLGHIYQRRWGKGGLFMTCILGTFFYGLWLGGGRVVYASFRDGDTHYAYLCQVGMGLPALPAVVQAMRTGANPPKAPLWDGFDAPPMLRGQSVPRAWIESQLAKQPEDPEYKNFDSEPRDANKSYVRYPGAGEHTDQLGYWNYKYGAFFDLGTVFTMIAGLLNVLVIWDAWGGPATTVPKKDSNKESKPQQTAVVSKT